MTTLTQQRTIRWRVVSSAAGTAAGAAFGLSAPGLIREDSEHQWLLVQQTPEIYVYEYV